MDVSIIIINYNTFELSKNAIESIFQHTQNLAYEIILVDNASPDSSGEKLKEYFGDKIVYIQSGGNLGTSKAFNLGVKSAKGKYVLWLNSDILLVDNFIKTLKDYMDEHSECGICGGNVIDFDGNPAHSFRRELPSARTVRKDRSIIRYALRKILKKKLSTEYNYTDKPMEVGYITGADMMTRRELLGRLGGFDERIFMYAEETEYTYRVKELGYTVVCVPYAKIKHLEGSSFSGKTSFSERRCLWSIQGIVRYMQISYGQKEAEKYLKILARSPNKLVHKIVRFNDSDALNTEKTKRKIAKEFLSKINQGDSVFDL